MPGTRQGGLKAAATVKKDNPDFYIEIGRLGGKASKGGGFRKHPELAREAGRKGGKISSRRKKNAEYQN